MAAQECTKKKIFEGAKNEVSKFFIKGEKNIGALLDDGLRSFKSISDKYSMPMMSLLNK